MNDIVIPKNTRGSNMEEPLWFDPDGKRPDNLSPEENARRDALVKKVDAIFERRGEKHFQQDKKD